MTKVLDVGTDINAQKVSILLYADDIVLISHKDTDLQLMLHVLNLWCNENKMSVNIDKSKIVHFRPVSDERTRRIFKIGDSNQSASICT